MQRTAIVRTIWLSVCLWTVSARGIAQQSTPAPGAVGSASIPAAADLAPARKLMQEGKLDEAIANLQSLQAANPAATGLDL